MTINLLDRDEIDKYLRERGAGSVNVFRNVCDFFDMSRKHYRRLAICERIAASMDPKRSMNSASDRRKIFRHIATKIGVEDGTVTKWSTAITDPPTERLLDYFDHVPVPIEVVPAYDRLVAWRYAIPRALLYIQLFPWPKIPKPVDETAPARRASKLVAKSKYFMRSNDINQSVLDHIIFAFPELAAAVQDVGAIRERMETRPSKSDPLIWPFNIFKYATFDRSWAPVEKNHPYKILWLAPNPDGIWGSKNGE
jgi:hypothetical protein